MGIETNYVVDTETLPEATNDVRKPELPGLLGNVFLKIENQVISLHAEWGIYRQLFEKEEDWSFLVRSSCFAWPILHDALVERCILRITRLTDPAASLSSKEKTNLSLAYLIGLLENGNHDTWLEELKADFDTMKTQIRPLKDLRDKVLAHTDEAVVMGNREYPVVSTKIMNSLIPQLAGFCQKIRSHFGLLRFEYGWCIGAWAGGITARYRKLDRFVELRNRVRRGEPLDVHQLRQAIAQAGQEYS